MKAPNAPDSTPKIDVPYFSRMWSVLARSINQVTFGGPGNTDSQISGSWYKGTTPSAPNTDFTIPHTLGRVPTGYLLLSIDKAAIVYKGGGTWTQSSITLRCNTASTNVVLLVV